MGFFSDAAKLYTDHVVPFVEHAVVPFVNDAAPVVAHHVNELAGNAGNAFHAAGQELTNVDIGAGFNELVAAAAPAFAVAVASLEGTAQAAAAFLANINLDTLVQDLHRDIETAVANIDGRVLAVGLAVAGGLVAAAVLIPIVVYFGLPALGFTADGVAAGSAAAAWQSILGNVAAGSLFAILQSAVAGGYGAPVVAGAVGAVGAGVGAGVAGGIAGGSLADKSKL
ncbi:hypothetical protein F503_03189 [Ophiostoma piceae UAMH 11346]|uniref:Uncharacterized protein n=1 Tax=Ophiostoma piceae (strain UAMH 11346) TaxID=1262450 RepID=S3C1Z9_OPHP1|nr:hypothetical protein F503_03189 [Ophiostoma piceae UAMH 11346]